MNAPDITPLLDVLHAQFTALQTMAREIGEPMAYGWQTNDVTGENELGYCPLSAVGPCFVHTVIAVVKP